MEASELVEVKIESIRTSQLTLHRVVVLSEQGGERQLPIWIGPFEADAIQLALEGTQPHRPMTHDLALRLIEPLGGTVRQIVINRIASRHSMLRSHWRRMDRPISSTRGQATRSPWQCGTAPQSMPHVMCSIRLERQI